MEIRIYQDSEGRAPFQRWLQAVQDRAARAKERTKPGNNPRHRISERLEGKG